METRIRRFRSGEQVVLPVQVHETGHQVVFRPRKERGRVAEDFGEDLRPPSRRHTIRWFERIEPELSPRQHQEVRIVLEQVAVVLFQVERPVWDRELVHEVVEQRGLAGTGLPDRQQVLCQGVFRYGIGASCVRDTERELLVDRCYGWRRTTERLALVLDRFRRQQSFDLLLEIGIVCTGCRGQQSLHGSIIVQIGLGDESEKRLHTGFALITRWHNSVKTR